jgi:hypothetical protein
VSTAVPAPAADVVEAFAAALISAGAGAVDLDGLLAAWAGADPGWDGSHGARLRLADALGRLDAEGTVTLPPRSGSRWDRALPALPTRLVVPANRRLASRALDPAQEPWVPALAWAAGWIRSTRPPQRLRVALVAINRWLLATTGRRVPRVCREERSLQVLGDEKAFASLAAGPLFAAGRLTWDVLVCDPPVGGLRVARLGAAGPVLVIENKATFDSAWRALRAVPDPGYAAVVFGSGDQASALVGDLVLLRELVGVTATRFDYAGDIDVAGVSAAAAFLDAAAAAELDARPAHALWDALAAAAPSGEDLTGGGDEQAAAVTAAGRLGLSAEVGAHLAAARRIPQERLDRTALADTRWWT